MRSLIARPAESDKNSVSEGFDLFQDAPLQPYFRLVYQNSIDITSFVIRANYEEQATTVHQLDITFKNGEVIIPLLKQGNNIKLYGGSIDKTTRNYRIMFNGRIKLIKTDPQDEGDFYGSLVAIESPIEEPIYKFKNYVYPSINCDELRPFMLELYKKKVFSYRQPDLAIDYGGYRYDEKLFEYNRLVSNYLSELYNIPPIEIIDYIVRGLSLDPILAKDPLFVKVVKSYAYYKSRALDIGSVPYIDRGVDYSSKTDSAYQKDQTQIKVNEFLREFDYTVLFDDYFNEKLLYTDYDKKRLNEPFSGRYAVPSEYYFTEYVAPNFFLPYKELIVGIAEENQYLWSDDSIVLPELFGTYQNPSFLNPIYQRDQSDWNFLVRLGEKLNCKVWTEPSEEGVWLYFIDMDKLADPTVIINRPSLIKEGRKIPPVDYIFRFPQRVEPEYDGSVKGNGGYTPESRGITFTDRKFVDESKYSSNPRAKFENGVEVLELRGLSVTEDIGLINAVSPLVSDLSSAEDDGIETRVIADADTLFLRTDVSHVDEVYNQVVSQAVARSQTGDERDANFVTYVDKRGINYVSIDSSLINRDEDGNIIGVKIVQKDNLGNEKFVPRPLSDLGKDNYLVQKRKYTYEIDSEALAALNPSSASVANIMTILKEQGFDPTKHKDLSIYIKATMMPQDPGNIRPPFEWRGIRITGTVDGRVNIVAQRWYRVQGVIHYSSKLVDADRYFLRAAIHTWDDSGYETKVELFI